MGKYGSFQANHIIGRPYHLTFEVLDHVSGQIAKKTGLRIVPTSEIYADIERSDATSSTRDDEADKTRDQDGVQYDIVGEDGHVVMRTNRRIIDDPTSQVMTMEEIETMKSQSTGSGKDLVAKILDSHSALDQKTAFALAKYTLRKTKKYLKRFTVLPLDVSTLAKWVSTEKEPMKIMELREEILALIGSWSNVRCSPSLPINAADAAVMGLPQGTSHRPEEIGGGRWLVVDETAGLLVAYMAEKMGILFPQDGPNGQAPEFSETDGDQENDPTKGPSDRSQPHLYQSTHKSKTPPFETTNTITLLHANSQPNLSLLKYFSFDAFNPQPSHPLSKHLKTLSWLQLLAPHDDAGYAEPEVVSDDVLLNWKGSKRSNYFRKRRRWERIKSVVDETRRGGFNGLVVTTVMSPISVLRHAIPLLRGAAQVVVYSPTVEPLVELVDLYSTARRTSFVSCPPGNDSKLLEDYPLDPMQLLAPTIYTARCRPWQVLPGRTHPLMTGKGGAECYVFTATRVLPAEGKIEARGKNKRRKVGNETTAAEGDIGALTVGM